MYNLIAARSANRKAFTPNAAANPQGDNSKAKL